MKNLILLLTLIISLTSISQVNEFGFFSGAGYYIGDLNKTHFSQQDLCFEGMKERNIKVLFPYLLSLYG